MPLPTAIVVAFTAALCVLFGLDKVYETDLGFCPFSALATVWYSELRAPHLSISQFQTIIDNNRSYIEGVDLVDTNYNGKYLSVKLRNDCSEYRVSLSNNCSADLLKRLNSSGISVGFYFSCL